MAQPNATRAGVQLIERTWGAGLAIIALAMAVERAEARPEPARVLGWV